MSTTRLEVGAFVDIEISVKQMLTNALKFWRVKAYMAYATCCTNCTHGVWLNKIGRNTLEGLNKFFFSFWAMTRQVHFNPLRIKTSFSSHVGQWQGKHTSIHYGSKQVFLIWAMTKHTHFKFKMVLSGKLGHKLDHFKFKMVLSGKLGHKLHHFNFNIALSGKIRQWCLERKKIFCGGDSFSKPINRLLHQGIKHQGIHKYISLLQN